MTSERIQGHIKRLLDEADQALTRFDWTAVKQHAEAVLTLDPGNADGRALVAAAERAMGDVPSPEATPTPVREQPHERATSFANGRYQVKDFLGEGGKKRVYQAHDSVLDRDVALAALARSHPSGPQ